MVVFQFHRGRTLLGKLIRVFSSGSYDHVSIRNGKYVYEATPIGVVKVPYKEWNSDTVHMELEVKSKYEKQVIKWLNKQVGKGYDYSGLLSFISIITKPVKGKWYCSELGMVTYSKLMGQDGDIDNQKISPYLLYKIIQLGRYA